MSKAMEEWPIRSRCDCRICRAGIAAARQDRRHIIEARLAALRKGTPNE